MRIATLAVLAAAALGVASANAAPVTWDLDATVSHTNLGAIGPIAVGDAFSASLTFDPNQLGTSLGVWDSYEYLNVFDAFSLNIGGKTLNLGPDSADPGWAREANRLGNATVPGTGVQTVQISAIVYDGMDPYLAYLWFDFTDLNAFPLGTLPQSPPSLASATFRDFSVYSPVNGDPRNGAIFIAGGDVQSLRTTSVPEPSTLALLIGVLALLPLIVRRRDRAASPT
jgi:hypothetical protein